MSLRDRQRIELGLTYPDDTAGGLLNTDVISVRPSHTMEVVINYLRDQDELPENTDKIFVVSKEDKYVGELSISKIITSKPVFNRKRGYGNKYPAYSCRSRR